MTTSLQIDDLRECRSVWREHEEWIRDEEQWAREWTREWDPWTSRYAPIDTDLVDVSPPSVRTGDSAACSAGHRAGGVCG